MRCNATHLQRTCATNILFGFSTAIGDTVLLPLLLSVSISHDYACLTHKDLSSYIYSPSSGASFQQLSGSLSFSAGRVELTI